MDKAYVGQGSPPGEIWKERQESLWIWGRAAVAPLWLLAEEWVLCLGSLCRELLEADWNPASHASAEYRGMWKGGGECGRTQGEESSSSRWHPALQWGWSWECVGDGPSLGTAGCTDKRKVALKEAECRDGGALRGDTGREGVGRLPAMCLR